MDDRQKPKRKNIRLKGYDYSTPGYYFLTMCTKDRKCLFGNISDHGMELNDAGKMVEKWFKEIDSKFKAITLDEYVVMPNHFHGLIQIVGANLCVRLKDHRPDNPGRHTGLLLREQKNNSSIPEIVQWFKTMTTNAYITGVKQKNWMRFDGKLWQRNYYEHVIRNDIDLNEIREYINNNPIKWHLDKENPVNYKRINM